MGYIGGHPNERDGHATVVDRTSGLVYPFGGFDSENAEHNGLWCWRFLPDGAVRRFEQLPRSSPPITSIRVRITT